MIDLRGGSACGRHRAALLDFVDRGEIVPSTGQALAHLERCGRCTNELESTVLTMTALRRYGDELARLEPSPDAWPRLRARLEGLRPTRWAIMSPSTGMVMSIALVAVLVAPLRVGTFSDSPSAADESGSQRDVTLHERRAENDYIRRVRQGTLRVSEPMFRQPGTYPRYVDGVREVRKEVRPGPPSGKPPEAI
ncbi:MAG: hypothetical protein ACJ76W_06345 [Chloroflexota bacterium]